MVERAFGPADGRPLMPVDYARLVRQAVEFVQTLWKHPAYVPAIRQQHLSAFDAFCDQLESRLPLFAGEEYRRLIEPHRAALVAAAKAE